MDLGALGTVSLGHADLDKPSGGLSEATEGPPHRGPPCRLSPTGAGGEGQGTVACPVRDVRGPLSCADGRLAGPGDGPRGGWEAF